VVAHALTASDEYTHDPSDDPQFNESVYFNMVAGDSGLAALIRIGNRVNEGHAEVTALVYLPGGGAAIRFAKVPITGNDRFDAGGLRSVVVEPLQHVRVQFDGTAHRLGRGTDLADPKRAFSSSPEIPLRLELDYRCVAPLYGLGANSSGASGLAGGEHTVATEHYEGACAVTGWIVAGDDHYEIDNLGFRDHSWGPRNWHGPRYWRWISCMVDEQNGFVAWCARFGDERQPGNGMLMRDGQMTMLTRVDVVSDYGKAPCYPTAMRISMTTDSGEMVSATGTVFATVPLRHRRDGVISRLAEVLCRYELGGRVGYGMSEYHDLILDGLPAGMNEA
jgi:hypothetical protein